MRLGMSNTLAKNFTLSTIFSSLGYFSNPVRAFTKLLQSNLKSLSPAQFTIEKCEVFRVASICQEIHVLSGMAWLTVAGKDIILTAGEKVLLDSNQGIAILSALGDVPLFLEIL